MKIYSENVLNKIYEIEKTKKYPIQIKCCRHTGCDVIFVPEALLLNYLYKGERCDIPYNKNDYFEIYYGCNTWDPNSWDFGKLDSISVKTTHEYTNLSDDQQLRIFEAYFDFLFDETQRDFDFDMCRDLVKDNRINRLQESIDIV